MAEYTDEVFEWDYIDNNGHFVHWWDSPPPSWGTGTGYYYQGSGGIYYFVSGVKRYKPYSETYPGFTLPAWLKDTSLYTDTLTNLAGGSAVQSTATLSLLMAANLLENNTQGLNALFNEILNSVFGSKFEEIAGRVNKLGTASVTLDAEIIAALGLDGLLEGDGLIIGKPELDVLIAGLRILKATFELIASYDWNTDFSFAKFDWADQNAFAAKLADADVSRLPFRNSFLNSQDPAMLNKSKQDYLAALSAISSVYDTMGNRDYIPLAAKDYLDDYKWIQDSVNKLHAVIANGGTFWIPGDAPPSGPTWTATQANAGLGVDMGKLFTLNYLKLNDIVEVTGTNPVFYGYNEPSDTWTKINSLSDIDSYEVLGFKIRLGKIKDLFPKGFDDSDNEVIVPMFPTEIGKEFYRKYYP
ncbi:MAG: hypothetical protein LBC62_05850 [Treponema sp.]|nr:hypothetical protein [Treponema sp.]